MQTISWLHILCMMSSCTNIVYAAQKQVHKLEQEQETARKRQKTEGAEFASTSTAMDTSYAAPITSEQTTTSSSCTAEAMEDIEDKLKSEAQERSPAQQEFFDMFFDLSYNWENYVNAKSIDLKKLENLLKNPAQLNLEEIIDTDNHETALLIASRSPELSDENRLKTMELLLNAGANPNAKDEYRLESELLGMTPLFNIARISYIAPKAPFINLLLEHGADVTARSQEGKSITDLIGIYNRGLPYRAVDNDAVELLFDLLRAGAPLPTNKEKNAVLFLRAIEQNDAKVITRFIQEGSMDINGVYGDARLTPLLHAATYNNIPALKTLIALGASVNKQDEEGDTILHYYIPRKNLDIVKLLINAGANVNIQNSDGRTPLMQMINSVLTDPRNFTPYTLTIVRLFLRGNELYGGTDFTLHDTVPFQKPGVRSVTGQNVEVQERSVEDYVEVYPKHDSPDVKRIKRAIAKEILKYKLEQATYKRNVDQALRETLREHSGKHIGPIIQEYLQGNKGFAAIARQS